MAAKVNLALLAALGVVWATLTLVEPASALDPDSAATGALVELEDAFATHRDDAALAQALVDAYLDRHRPELVIGALGAADPSVRRAPAVLRGLAQAYESTGHLEDADATLRLAHALCARSLGAEGGARNTPVPEHACSQRTLVAIQVQGRALEIMRTWGVRDPVRDPRATRARELAFRPARVLTAELR